MTYDCNACERMVLKMLIQAINYARGEGESDYIPSKYDWTTEQSKCANFIASEDFDYWMMLLDISGGNIGRIINHAREVRSMAAGVDWH